MSAIIFMHCPSYWSLHLYWSKLVTNYLCHWALWYSTIHIQMEPVTFILKLKWVLLGWWTCAVIITSGCWTQNSLGHFSLTCAASGGKFWKEWRKCAQILESDSITKAVYWIKNLILFNYKHEYTIIAGQWLFLVNTVI